MGLTAALLVSLILLFFSLGYYITGGKIYAFRFLHALWTSRERVRDWFLYLSIVTGVIGIVSTILSVAVPPFLSLTLSPFIPIAFDTVSVLSALLEFTVYVPPYHNIYSLVYRFILESKIAPNPGEPYVEDLDFPKIAAGTNYTHFELRDGMEVLVAQGFASKIAPTPLGNVGFKLNEHGMKFLQAVWNETRAILERRKDTIEAEIHYLTERLRSLSTIEQDVGERARRQIHTLGKQVNELSGDYGSVFEQSWSSTIERELAEMDRTVAGRAKPGSGKQVRSAN